MSQTPTLVQQSATARAKSEQLVSTAMTWQLAVVFLMMVLSLSVFFRQQILDGFTVLSGDRFDGMLETTMLEHWNNFFHGRSSFNRTNYFYPFKDTLGYNDAFFLYGAIYSIVRSFGANPFIASECVNIVILTIGFVSMTLCGVIVLDLGLLVAGFTATLFILSSSIFIQLGHAQLLSLALAPLLTTLIFKVLVSLQSRQTIGVVKFGVLAAIVHAIWLYSTFYMAWYYVYYAFWVGIISLGLNWRRLGEALPIFRRSWYILLPLLAFYLAINIPFAMTYFPKIKETGQHSFQEVLYFTPSLFDIVNVGPDNLLFGKADSLFNSTIRPGFPEYGERTVGFPPILLFLFAAAIFQAGRVWRRTSSVTALTALTLGLAAIASCATAVKIGDHTLWYYVYSFFPGGKATRALARYLVFLTFPVTLLVGYHLQRWRWVPLTSPVIALAALLLAEQIVLRNNVFLPAVDEFHRLSSFTRPPDSCKSFYVTASRENSSTPGVIEGIYSHNADAMLLAEYFSVPTLNGFATFTPAGWNLFRPNERDRYQSDVATIIDRFNLKHVCSLDLSSRQWTVPK